MPRYPWFEVVLTVGTWDTVLDVYPDTGFEGGLAIPSGMGREIVAGPVQRLFRLASDEVGSVDAWDGRLELEGRTFRVEVIALGSQCLLGREVLDRLDIRFEFGRRLHLRFGDE